MNRRWPLRTARRFSSAIHTGVVIREAGNDPKVPGLVYIAAHDQGESVSGTASPSLWF